MTTTKNRYGSATVELRGDRELVITRKFDAPAALVFKAMNSPEYVKRWWGFDTSEWIVCELDPRVGGKWRNVIRDDGFEVGFHGEYLEMDEPNRFVLTEVYEGVDPGDDSTGSTNTVTLVEENGVTTMTVNCMYVLPEHRDGLITSGMEDGMQISYNRLEDLLSEIA